MAANPDLSTLLRVKRTSPQAPAPAVAETSRDLPRVADASLDDRCEVLRFLSLHDETGGISEAWTQAGCYPCRIELESARGRGGGEIAGVEGQTESISPYLVYLPKFAQITSKDRLGIPGWFNVWQANQSYGIGERVLAPVADSFLWECAAPVSDATPPPDSPHWARGRRVVFLEIDEILPGATDENVFICTGKEVTT